MKTDVTNNTCSKRGCEITLLPSDSRVRTIVSRVYGTRNDIQKVLPMAYLSLDKELEKEGQMEAIAA